MRKLLIFATILLVIVAAAWFSGEREPMDEIAIAEEELGVAFESRMVDIGDGQALHVVMAGPKDGPPVILLHGFPEFWYSWRRQIADLSDRGYRVIAPDLLGYNRSSKPKGQENYSVDGYSGDIVAMMDGLNIDSAYVSGHDVGAVVAWGLVFSHPARIRKAVIFNVAQPLALNEAFNMEGVETVSWYRAFFRWPFVPELVLRAGGWAVLGNSLQSGSREGAFSDKDVDIYKSAWARDNAISTMLGFYRMRGVGSALNPDNTTPPVPVRLILAAGDPFLPVESAEPSRRYLGDDNVIIWEDVSHWTLQEEPRRTVEAMAGFFDR